MKNKIPTKLYLLVLLLPLAFISCSKTEDDLPDKPVPIDLSQVQVSMIESGNEFAFDIFSRTLNGAGENENVMISPLSISYALSMTLNGASGETRDAMLEALRLQGIDVSDINTACMKLTEALLSVDKRVLMNIANSVWTENDFVVKQAFIDILKNFYNAESESFDISDPTAPDKINRWIEDETNGLIKKMVDKLEDNTVMLLINAIYFKGKWKSQFDKDDTVDELFYKVPGSGITVPMMKQKNDFMVYQGTGFKLAEFPYGQGNFVMDVILPDNEKEIDVIKDLVTESNFTAWVSMLSEQETNVTFPRFKYGFKKKFKDVLSDMGMGIAFTDFADFANISEQYDLLINDVTHQSFIETNEEGTEAAAATIVDIGLTSMPQIFEFKMDHPFIYIIRETTTNSIIFMGRVSDPSVN